MNWSAFFMTLLIMASAVSGRLGYVILDEALERWEFLAGALLILLAVLGAATCVGIAFA
jgi:hypothetical protein